MAVSNMISYSLRSKTHFRLNKKSTQLDYQIGIPEWLTKYIKKNKPNNILVIIFTDNTKHC